VGVPLIPRAHRLLQPQEFRLTLATWEQEEEATAATEKYAAQSEGNPQPGRAGGLLMYHSLV